MPASQVCRFAVEPASTLDFEAKSSLHPVHGKASGLAGYVAASVENGALVLDPPPAMHVDFPVEKLTSGNAMQDSQMWKLLDSKRSPRIFADLRHLEPAGGNTYRASGDITLVGRVRTYDGDLTVTVDADETTVTVDGSLVLDIRDFGIAPPRLLMITVQPQVTVKLHLSASLPPGVS